MNTETTSLKPDIFALGDLNLQNGNVLPDAILSFATAGQLNAQRDNCIVLPAYVRGLSTTYSYLIGPGCVIDTDRYFVVVTTLFGNGESSSPSNSPWVSPEAPFPDVTIGDNIRAQARLVFDHLGVEHICLVAGGSMGALQAYAWGAAYPERIASLLCWCGSFQCWPLNQLFLESLITAIRSDPAYRRGGKSKPRKGLETYGTIYAGWAFSAAFYRDRLYENIGSSSMADVVRGSIGGAVDDEPDDILTMLSTWQSAGPESLFPGESLADILGRIRARTITMPCDTDMYFPVRESEIEASLIPNAELRILSSPYGHAAGFFDFLEYETATISAAIADLLNDVPERIRRMHN